MVHFSRNPSAKTPIVCPVISFLGVNLGQLADTVYNLDLELSNSKAMYLFCFVSNHHAQAPSPGPNMSSGLSTFRRLGSRIPSPPNTAPSLVDAGFCVLAVACSRRACCKATRSARSGSRHFCSFLRKGFIDLTISGCGC